ncbi:amino acid/polyamine/organocation transporter, APC superfamily [Methylobacillus rhizosphaerae]|uniref:Amino acid/polyamine/organocation transporter, APC superfamily n=1 Tax=Methylobacillus rhizosphaerae TaxID=551994 RepID=A0A239A4T0_9PROT|nr:amino acid permease [Methylobacillus rhizosphaerae]SNR90509.1 amino acid/polyamine/organocation transporter, APC superfamily [Methylobacillus rhizosphaerae]
MFAQLFRTKPIEIGRHSGLRKCLTAFDLALLGIGCAIGTGIFVLTGIAAAVYSGPAVIISFIIAGLAAGFAGFAYAELAASVGGSGSAYGYTYVAFGEFFAWVIAWILLLEYGVGAAAVANGWSGYFINTLANFHIVIPDAWTKAPSQGGIINLPAFGIIWLLVLVLVSGVKQSSTVNNIMVVIKISTIAIFLAIAVGHINTDNWQPFMPFGWFSTQADGHNIGILAGASLVFFAYFGFDAVSTAADEARNPQRDLPIGLIAALIFCTVIYILVAGMLTGVVHYSDLNVSSPVAYALATLGYSWSSTLVATGILAGLITVLLVLLYGLTRILYAMSHDGLIPAVFSKVNPERHTPTRLILLCGSIISIVAGFFPLGTLAETVNIGTLASFIMVCCGVIILRIRQPDLPRPFKNPWNPLIPLLGIVSCSALMAFLPDETWHRFLIWVGIGIVMYFVYSMRHSKLRTK